MLRMTRLPLLVVAASGLMLPAAASAADCHLQAPRIEVDHPIAGTDLVARDPYGGLLTRNRLFFDFSVRGSAVALADVAKVQWSLDGTVVREDPKAPFEWKGLSGSSKRMPVGEHQITVTVVPKSGANASAQFALTATDCQNASFDGQVLNKRGPASFSWASAFESTDGEPLTSVSAIAARNVAVRLPTALRGRSIGTVKLTGANQAATKTYTLKGRTAALTHGKLKVRLTPGAKSFLRVSGLPAGTQAVTVTFKSGIVALRAPKSPYRVGSTLSSATRSIIGPQFGGIYV
jgi:hypothetical protein